MAVLPITVAALATTPWIARHLTIPAGVDRVILPGLCQGDLDPVAHGAPAVPVERGPDGPARPARVLRHVEATHAGYGAYDIEILAEINHAPRLTRAEILLASPGACAPTGPTSSTWAATPARPGPASATRCARCATTGCASRSTASIRGEVEAAVAAGAELVLSVNGTNVDGRRRIVGRARSSPLPDMPAHARRPRSHGRDADGVRRAVPHRSRSSSRSASASPRRWAATSKCAAAIPDAEMMMGVGNLTELTDVDSAGVNVLLLGFCQELGIRSVLTTEVINWCRSCVRELDLARRLVHHACTRARAAEARSSRTWCCSATRSCASTARRCWPNWPRRSPTATSACSPSAASCTSSTARCTLQGTDPFALFERDARHDPKHRPVARLLPGLRDGQGGDGADAGQELHAGPGTALGLPGCGGAVKSQQFP